MARIFLLSGVSDPITARQVRHFVTSGELDPQAEVRVAGKWTVINAQRVIDVLERELGDAVPYEALLQPIEKASPQAAAIDVDPFHTPVEPAGVASPAEREPFWDWRKNLLVQAASYMWVSHTEWMRNTNKWVAAIITILSLYIALCIPVGMILKENAQLDVRTLLLIPLVLAAVPVSFYMFLACALPFIWIGERSEKAWWQWGWSAIGVTFV